MVATSPLATAPSSSGSPRQPESQTRGLRHAPVARFASLDELVRIEIKGSPLAALVDERAYEKILDAARRELRKCCDAQGKVSVRLDAAIVTASKS